MIGELISQYGRPQSREAFIFKNRKGFFVELYRETMLVRVVECFNHSESYAEDVAENWVQKILN
tara:strand:+ start:1383 stop:1574 length:192 start_codon:yes stop_codon:yes gene_type:complete